MSQFNLRNNKPVVIRHHPLKDQYFLQELKHKFHDILMSIYGPRSGALLIQNSGGEDFLTSSSEIILQQVQFDHPIAKLIKAVINAQHKAYGTHGSYIGIVASGLLYQALKLDVPSRIVMRVSNSIIEQLESDLVTKSSQISQKLDFSKAKNILSIVEGIIGSKIKYDLTAEERYYFCCKVAECFVKSLPSEDSYQKDFSTVNIFTIDGPSTNDSMLREGIFYKENLKTTDEIEREISRKGCSHSKVAHFNVPLAYIKEDSCDAMCSISSYNDYLTQLIIQKLRPLGVRIIANQKYIDETIKYQLEKEGFLVLDRLGTSLMTSLIRMCGGFPLSEFDCNTQIEEKELGLVGRVCASKLFDQTYIHLTPSKDSPCLTFFVTGINRHVNSYLENSARTCIDLLQMMVLKDSRVVIGGGCLESYIVFLLMKMEKIHLSQIVKNCDASAMSISQVYDVFIQMFLKLAVKSEEGSFNFMENYYIDSIYGHLWRIKNEEDDQASEELLVKRLQPSCVCKSILRNSIHESDVQLLSLLSVKHKGCDLKLYDTFLNEGQELNLVKNGFQITSDSIVDYLPAKLNAIRMALGTFSELIRVSDCYIGN